MAATDPSKMRTEHGLGAGLMLTISQRNREQSPLLRLPGELRNRIYEFAIGGHVVDVLHRYFIQDRFISTLPVRGPKDASEKFLRLLNLAHTCRQLYEETRLLPYALNIFCFYDDRWFMAFSSILPSSAKSSIRQIMFCRFYARQGDRRNALLAERKTYPNLELIYNYKSYHENAYNTGLVQGEICNRIYDFVIGDGPLYYLDGKYLYHDVGTPQSTQSPLKALKLPFVCHQLRTETKVLQYSSGRIWFLTPQYFAKWSNWVSQEVRSALKGTFPNLTRVIIKPMAFSRDKLDTFMRDNGVQWEVAEEQDRAWDRQFEYDGGNDEYAHNYVRYYNHWHGVGYSGGVLRHLL
ncbi:hypothetical protein E8E13_007635 [Curvularia kusanoi]|uniref:DUF7730 domain-containing protein n=1 Tax=Curvularia kusanoi TaxID=90978 RepID=A0A9P4TDG9_CURKU|nr:hypothetical protein E8E13_007635 [Curvularia kusanoi]